jgi:PAS domain S-box-containing protein
MFVAWGPDLTLIYNDGYASILGNKHPRALGQAFSEAWSDIWPQFGPIVRAVMAGEAQLFDDLPIPMQRYGYPEDTWFSFSYTPLRDESGQIAGLFCACSETTSKVHAEQALRAQEAKLEARVAERTADLDRVWRNSRDLLVVVGEDGFLRAVNPAWTAVLGYEPNEMVGRSFLDFIWPDDAASTRGALDRAVQRDDLTNFENRYRHKDGTPRWLSWSASAEGDLVYAYGRHITAEKEQAEVLRLVEARLRQAQKMEAVGQLTSGLAHDFNNLLMGISGSLELLKMRLAQGRTVDLDHYIEAAQSSAGRAARLTHRLLAFSRQQTLEPKPVEANRLIAGMADLIGRTIGPAIQLITKLDEGLWPTLCDPNQLENALLNLCINARDAMPDGGQLTIHTSNTWLDEKAAGEHDMQPGQYVTFCVIDTGAGMTPEVQSRAFDPFFTTKPAGEGTGLGLSMVYGFVQQSGGEIRIVSEPGAGTTICFYMPRYSGVMDEDGERDDQPEVLMPTTGRRVMVVDDEETVRSLIGEVLADLGHSVIEAVDGTSALEVLRSDLGVDLLVSDVGLPGDMNGRQLVDAIRETQPGLKVLFITGYAEQAIFGDGRLSSATQVMTKPFAMEALATRIEAMLNES